MEMETGTTLHLLCGKMAAGKSTLARTLEEKHGAALLVEDEWLAELYPEEITRLSDYIQYSSRLKRILLPHVQSLLLRGTSVVLDFPANTREQRNTLRTLYEQANVLHVLHYVDVSDAGCKHQLRERSKNKPPGSAFTSDAEFDAITKYFQPPTDDEGFNVVRHQQ